MGLLLLATFPRIPSTHTHSRSINKRHVYSKEDIYTAPKKKKKKKHPCVFSSGGRLVGIYMYYARAGINPPPKI